MIRWRENQILKAIFSIMNMLADIDSFEVCSQFVLHIYSVIILIALRAP